MTIRKPYWNPTAKLELPPKVGDGHGVWFRLHDCGTVSPITIWAVRVYERGACERNVRDDDWLPT